MNSYFRKQWLPSSGIYQGVVVFSDLKKFSSLKFCLKSLTSAFKAFQDTLGGSGFTEEGSTVELTIPQTKVLLGISVFDLKISF